MKDSCVHEVAYILCVDNPPEKVKLIRSDFAYWVSAFVRSLGASLTRFAQYEQFPLLASSNLLKQSWNGGFTKVLDLINNGTALSHQRVNLWFA